MKTLFWSRDLWGLVEKGFNEDDDEVRLNENQKKDAKALYLIQQALDERILIRITEAQTSKQAWEILRTEYQVLGMWSLIVNFWESRGIYAK